MSPRITLDGQVAGFAALRSVFCNDLNPDLNLVGLLELLRPTHTCCFRDLLAQGQALTAVRKACQRSPS